MRKTFWLLLGLSIGKVTAQSVTSPYTIRELGEFHEALWPHYAGMSNVGMALPLKWQLQGPNPALLSHSVLTHVQFSLLSDARRIQSENHTTRLSNINLGPVTFSLPLRAEHWGLRFGFSPYTTVNYSSQESINIENDENTTTLHKISGSGGLHQFHIAQGVKISTYLHIGLSLQYYAGSIQREDHISVRDPFFEGWEADQFLEHTYKGLGYTVGLYYAFSGTATGPSIGLSYTPGVSLTEARNLSTSYNSATDVTTPISIPQTVSHGESIAYLPEIWQIGLGYTKENIWQIGLDVTQKTYRSSSVYQNSWSVALGSVLVPNYESFKYFARLPYRIGLRWQALPYTLSGKQIQEFSASAGSSVVLKSGSKIDFAVQGGFRGENKGGSAYERYIKLYLSSSFSNKWFIKERYN